MFVAHGLCWNSAENPFTGPPTADRIDSNSVRLDWSSVFEPQGNCDQVDFLIKSHPRFQPAAYKLSDYTLKGQRNAVLRIDGNTDFVFQVIAREDKGDSLGIDYKYSPMVTSYATDVDGAQSHHAMPVMRAQVSSTTTRRPRPRTTRRMYKKPPVRSLPSIYEDYVNTTPRTTSTKIDTCLPLLRGYVGPGSNMQQDRLLINFVRYMNQRPLEIVSEFLQTKRSCKEEHKKGFLLPGSRMCCPTPWSQSDDSACYNDYITCDGRCIPAEWRDDGWPDCMDGSDENGDKTSAKLFQCVQCSGVILSAKHLCSTSGRGLSEECVGEMIGEGDCNICVKDYF